MAEKRSRAPLFIALAVGAIVVAGCSCMAMPLLGTGLMAAAFGAYDASAAPIARIGPFVESDERVRAALGAPVSVSMIVTRTMERELRPDGSEHVTLITSVSGSSREGRLTVHAENVGGQGWAGTWEVEADGARVLRDGRYTSEGGGVIASGRFEPDGTPVEAR